MLVPHPAEEPPLAAHPQEVSPPRSPIAPAATPFLNYLHSLRAVAIIFVVVAHCVGLFEWSGPEARLIPSIASNSTVIFVFIAGFLFQHLSSRFEYRKYLKSKLQNVLLPYLAISFPILIVKARYSHGLFNPANSDHLPTLVQNVVWSLLTGVHILVSLWFIPMIAIFYLLAPAWLWIDRNGRIYHFLPLLLLGTVLVHRPMDFDHIGHHFAYFAPVYLYGMWFSRHQKRLIAWHDRWSLGLWLAVAFLVWLEVGYLGRAFYIRSIAPFSTEAGIIDINAVQKLLLCGLLAVMLTRVGDRTHRVLGHLAEASFGVYFLHMFFIMGYLVLFGTYPSVGIGAWRFWLSVAAVLTLSSACLWLAKRAFGRHSRFLVGF